MHSVYINHKQYFCKPCNLFVYTNVQWSVTALY